MRLINGIDPLPLPRYSADGQPETDPPSPTAPAAPFPDEPGDVPAPPQSTPGIPGIDYPHPGAPEPQPGDPGPDAPVSLKRMYGEPHVADYITASFRGDRYEVAFATMMQGLASCTRHAAAAVAELRHEDVTAPAMAKILQAYVESTSDFAKTLTALVENKPKQPAERRLAVVS